MLRDPVTRLNVEPNQVRVQFLLLGDEAGHHRYPDLSGEEPHDMEERGERQDAGWGVESAGEERLQDDRGDEADERERLTHGHEQFGPEVVLGRPRAGHIRIHEARDSHDRKPTCHQQAGVETFVQQVGCEEGETQLRNAVHNTAGPI